MDGNSKYVGSLHAGFMMEVGKAQMGDAKGLRPSTDPRHCIVRDASLARLFTDDLRT